MRSDTFWQDLERVFANEDNARFDNQKRTAADRRKIKLLTIGVAFGIALSVFAAFFNAGSIIFRVMPLPPEQSLPSDGYHPADRAGLGLLVIVSR